HPRPLSHLPSTPRRERGERPVRTRRLSRSKDDRRWVMEGMMERALPFVAAWGAWSLAILFAVALFGIWRLGQGRRLLLPARWPARLGSAGLLILALISGFGLYGLLGPMRPMLDQVRYIRGTVGQPAGDLAFRQVADDAPRRLSELRGKV